MTTLPERQAKIDEYFDNFLANESEDDSLDEIVEALDEVIYKALLEKLGHSNSGDEQKRLVRQKMSEFMIRMDSNAPGLAHAEKMLRSIGIADFKKAASYLEQLYAMRSTAFNKIQSQHAQKPRKKDPITELLVRMRKLNPEISAEDAIAQLESDICSHVVTDYDDENIYFECANGQEKSIAKVNIASRLSRLRK